MVNIGLFKSIHSRRIFAFVLLLIAVGAVLCILLWAKGCRERPDITARFGLLLNDPTRPGADTLQSREFAAVGMAKGWLWEYGRLVIEDREYFTVTIYTPPKAASGMTLSDNEVLKLLIERDANSAAQRRNEILLLSKINVDVSVVPPHLAQSVVNTISGRSIAEQGLFGPGTYSFRMSSPVSPANLHHSKRGTDPR